jgi:uncharacterized cupredoxin-like copper-binding protein
MEGRVTKKTTTLLLAGLAILAITLVLAAACGGDDGSGGAGAGDVAQIRVKAADSLRFEPSEIRLTAGQPVRLMMENMGASIHDFTVDQMPMMGGGATGAAHDMSGMTMGARQYAMHLAVESHRDGTVEFTPTAPGTYTFYCTASGHREAGMEGKMIVE